VAVVLGLTLRWRPRRGIPGLAEANAGSGALREGGGVEHHASLPRWPALPESKMPQDLLAHGHILHDGDQPHLAAALRASQNVFPPHAAKKLRPGETASTPGIVRTGEVVGGVLLGLLLLQVNRRR
jgi:hypothetical protein